MRASSSSRVTAANFDLGDLRAFVAVSELGSFGGAAESIHISQPALSRRIEKLEVALGVRLFDRTTRSVQLTTIGRSFAKDARRILADLEETLLGIKEVAVSRRGEITIGCVPSAASYFLPNVLHRYREAYPGISIRIIDAGANEVLNAVVKGHAEFGIDILATQEPNVEFRPILREQFIAACLRDHSLARRRTINWADLSGYDLMTIDRTNGNRLLLDSALASAVDRPQWAYEARQSSILLGLVEEGLGIAIVPELALTAGKHPTLKGIPVLRPTVRRTVGLISRRGQLMSPPAQHLYAFFEEWQSARTARLSVGS